LRIYISSGPVFRGEAESEEGTFLSGL